MPGCLRRLPLLLLPALLLPGCGGGTGAAGIGSATTTPPPAAPPPAAPPPDPPGPFSLAPASLTLPVPSVRNQPSESPYSGTVTIALDRTGYTGPVTLALDPSALPPGVQAGFADPTLSAGTSVATLSVQAGYADPTNGTLTYPALGSYAIPVTASAPDAPGAGTAAGTLTLDLVPEPNDFTLSFFAAAGWTPTILSSLNLLPGVPLVEPFEAYWTHGGYTSYGPVTLSLQDLPPLLTVLIDGQAVPPPINLNEPHSLSLQGQPGLAAGSYGFSLSASFQGLTRTLPVAVSYSPAPFYIQPPPGGAVAVAQGQTLTLPLYLWHDDTFFVPVSGTDPAYLGETELSVAGVLPSGLRVSFPQPDPIGQAAAPLQLSADQGLAPGSYPVALQATRVGTATVPAAPLILNVAVTGADAAPVLWIQNVEWGQGVVAPGLRLVGGKPALLRVQLLADRAGVAAPPVTATVLDPGGGIIDTLTLQGPAQVPVTLTEGDLPTAAAASGSSYTALLPARDIQPGLRLTLQGGPLAPRTLAPAVAPGTVLDLTVVPVICAGLAPELPSDAVMTQALTAFWPLQGVNLMHRAPYTTATVMPQPDDPESPAAWAELLSEIASLRITDGQSANYYGFVNPGIIGRFGFGITGISRLGAGAGVGIDEAASGWFQHADPAVDFPTLVLVHEQGHAFNLNHAPAGGAGNPELDYPYAGASIGSWGYDPAAQQPYDPSRAYDIMSYAPASRWISDWNYRLALAWLEQNGAAKGAAASAASAQWVVSGWIGPGGQAHLAPLVRLECVPAPPRPGPLSLRLERAGRVTTLPFAADPVPDLPAGHLHFCFTVPAAGELARAEIRVPGGRPSRRVQTRSLASRARALAAAARDGSLVVRERSGVLHLEWDPRAHPYLDVVHEGAHRTTLALHLAGGGADLPLAGLPPGGRFSLHYSDGLNEVVRVVGRCR